MWRHRFSLPLLMAFRAFRMFSGKSDGFRILLFHNAPRESFADFSDFIEYVKQTHGVISPEQAEAWLNGEKPEGTGESPCLFTFDDGFASNFSLAGEVLDRHGVKALFFVCPGLMDLGEDAQRKKVAENIFQGRRGADDLPPGMRLMSWEEITELNERGHAIGAHGMSHQRLSQLTGEALSREILESGVQLEDRLGRGVDWFAYAFGDINSISREALEIISERYRFCRSGVRGVNSKAANPHALRADHVDMTAPMAYGKLILEGGLDFRYAQARRLLDEMAG